MSEQHEVEQVFSKVGEKEVTRAILRRFTDEFLDYVESDCLIVGGGPSGLIAARELAKKGVKTLLVEKNNYLGGGYWQGGYFMNKVTFRAPSEEVLDELGLSYEEDQPGLYVADGPDAVAKLISAAYDAGAKIVNLTKFDDVVLREQNRVGGAVINWSAIDSLPKQVSAIDPIAVEADVVVDATGHDACVARKLEDRGLMEVPGEGGMWVERSEDVLLHRTGKAYPGLVVTGMAVAAIHALPRMGPTFGGMLLSGKRAAEAVLEELGRN